jgi:hypothetical protein
MKWISIITLVIGIAIAFIGYKMATFEIFDVEKTSLAKLPVSGKDYVIDISFVQAGATTEDVIQIKKVFSNGKEEIIKNFSKYNCLVKSKLIKDTIVQVILVNTYYYANEPDTLDVIIK